MDIAISDADVVVGNGSEASISFQFLSELRQGRWKMENAYGPETSALKMQAYPQYYSSAGVFSAHVDDQCTLVSPSPSAAVTLGSGSTTLSVSSPLNDAENENFSFSVPGSGNVGRVPVSVDLSSLPWLRYDWDGDGSALDDHPQVEAFFGQYRGHDRVIYWREVSN